MDTSTDRLTLHLLNILIYLFMICTILLLQFHIQYSIYAQYSNITKILPIQPYSSMHLASI